MWVVPEKVKRVADDDLAATWLLFCPWAKYTGKRTSAGYRYSTCSCCLENNPDVSKYGKGEGAVVADKSDLTTHDASRSHLTAMECKAAKAGAPGGIRIGMAAAAAATTTVKTLFPTLLLVAWWSAYAKLKGLTRLHFSLFNKTRWFSRMQCITTLCMNLPYLILFLQAKPDWPAGQAFLKKKPS